MNYESLATNREGSLVPGEYNVVARASRDVDAMLLAHATPITKAEAIALINRIARDFEMPTFYRVLYSARFGRCAFGYRTAMQPVLGHDGTPLLTWKGKQRRRAVSARGLDGRPVIEYRVSLPRASRLPATPNAPYSGLRVGLVLHEVAHMLHHVRTKRMNHSPEFTAVLDDLIAWWMKGETK